MGGLEPSRIFVECGHRISGGRQRVANDTQSPANRMLLETAVVGLWIMSSLLGLGSYCVASSSAVMSTPDTCPSLVSVQFGETS